MGDFFLFLIAALSAAWLLWSAGRLNQAWLATQKRKQELDVRRVDMAMQLMRRGEDLMRLKGEDTGASERLSALRAHCTQRQNELAAFKPPPPPEIIVTSEYASSRDDKAWVVKLMPTGSRTEGEAVPAKQYLLWAGDHGAAISRARNVIGDEPGYEIQQAQRYV
jgi:hypothetical protein